MPQPVLSWLVRLLPEWFLPPTVILKERNGEKPAESYENELDTYHHLRSLQGTYIPRLYGEAAVYTCAPTRRRRGRSASNAAAAPTGAWRWTPGGRTPPVCLLVADYDVFGLMGSADAVLGKAVSRSR